MTAKLPHVAASATSARRLLHVVAASALPLLSLGLSKWPLAALSGAAVLVGLTLEAVRLRSAPVNGWLLARFGVFFRGGERKVVTGATWLAVGACAAYLLFDTSVASLVMLFVAFGDPAASVVGGRFGSHRIGARSLEGACAYAGVSGLIAVLGWAGGWYAPLWPALAAAAVAAFTEVFPLALNDNLSVPLAAGGALTLFQAVARGVQ
jgi:dolichol kinase